MTLNVFVETPVYVKQRAQNKIIDGAVEGSDASLKRLFDKITYRALTVFAWLGVPVNVWTCMRRKNETYGSTLY